MASDGAAASTSIPTAGTSKTVSASLWWDSFVALSDDLDRATAGCSVPDALAKRIKSHHAWLRGSVSMFRKPNDASRSALDAGEVAVGEHRLTVKPELKKAALRASKCLILDEVQSYILVKRSSEISPTVSDADAGEFLHLVSVRYYLERQCLLKCIRRIFVHASDGSDSTDPIRDEASLLISEEIERKLISIIEDSFSDASSVKAEAEFTVSIVEETLIEVNLILDILFLAFYDNFSRCNGRLWITLCSIFKDILCGSYDVGKFAVSVEAKNSFHYAKAQLLIILIETLDFENLLRMIRDEVPLSGGCSAFSVGDILEMDVEISKLPEFSMVESGPLILAWAVFLCLVLSLPESNANLEIDHTSYAQRAFEFTPFNYLLGVLCSSIFRESDGPVSGYRGILRTFVSAFIASYEIPYQREDSSLDMISSILCEVYDGEESLCMQFWDKDSFVDGPIRSVLHMVEEEYPFQISKLIRFLSAVCHGTWPAHCVYNYLERMNGVTTIYASPSVTDGVAYRHQIESHHSVSIPGIVGIVIPHGTHGYILKVLQEDTALVRWEFPHSGVFFLLMTLAQDLHSCNYKEASDIMDLLYRMVSSNKDLCFALLHVDKSPAVQTSMNLGQIEKHVRIDIAKIFCNSVFKYVRDVNNAEILSKTFGLLAEMIKYAPYHVFDAAFKCNIFTSQLNGQSSDWLLSGALARMLFVASEGNGDCSSLATSVLDFTIQVLEKGAAADDIISPLVIFSIQYIMVNHVNWTHKECSRWKITLRVFELVKRCFQVKPFSSKLGGIIWEILLYDSSVHGVLWSILSVSTQFLQVSYRSSYHGLKDIEDIQLVLRSGLDIIYYILSNLPEDVLPNPPFIAMVLSPSLKPFSFVTALISLMSFHNSDMQIAATRSFSALCFIAYKAQPQLTENANFTGDVSEIQRLESSISCILDEDEKTNDCLVVAVFNLLTSVARYQPAYLISLIEQSMKPTDHTSANGRGNGVSVLSSKCNARLVDQILDYVERSMELMNRSPLLLLSILDLLKALWESGIQFLYILEKLRSSVTFWENLSQCIRATLDICSIHSDDAIDEKFSLRYHCQGKIFEIISHELFLHGKLLAETSNTVQDGPKEPKEHNSGPCRSNVVLKWFDTAILDDLISNLSSNAYKKELLHHAKVAACLCIIHLITKLSTGHTGSLSFSLLKKIQVISAKLSQHHVFLALLSQYSLHGYSGEQELSNLVLNDLYYHIRGELEGRQITSGPFQELLNFLLEFKLFEHNPLEQLQNTSSVVNDNVLFDVEEIHDELGVDLWTDSDRKRSKEVAKNMLDIMSKANLMKCYADAKLSTLRSFLTFLSVYTGAISNKSLDLPDGGISVAATQSAVRCACESFESTVDSLLPHVDANEVLFPLLSGQVQLLLTLARVLFHQAMKNKKSIHLCPDIILLMKTSGASTSFLVDLMPSAHALKQPVKALLVLLLSSYEFMYGRVDIKGIPNDVNMFGELAVLSLSLLPILCKLAENRECSDLAVTSMDLILKGFVPSNVWVPILQKHFHLQAILHKCQNGDLLSTQVILNFLLTLGRTKDGAKFLQSANIFAFLKVLLSQLSLDDSCLRNSLSDQVKDVNLWSLGLAVVASLNHCLDDDISHSNVANSTISFLSGQVPLMSSYLSVQSVTSHQSKKRALSQKSQTSLSALSLTENILILLCILAKYNFPRDTGKKEVDSELREIIIHLLAFISKGNVKAGDASNWNSSFFCPAVTKEEVALNEKPPLICSKYGWFKFAASCTMSTAAVSVSPSAVLSVVIRDKSSRDSDSTRQTRFTEILAVQIYRIAFLIMKFLCNQAKEAVKRAEQLEFLDLAHFPELPMPDILHGLQDQVVCIVTEVFEANGSSTLNPETEKICQLLLVILETSLYMELCVSQSCGIRPVLGRLEDFCKGIKAMLQAMEKQSSFKPFIRSLTEISTLLYPGLLQSNLM